jgi:hypothetical protein
MTIGTYKSASKTVFPLNLYLYIPTAAKVPITVEMTVLDTATIKLFCKAFITLSSLASTEYQFNVNPSQVAFNLEVLKE